MIRIYNILIGILAEYIYIEMSRAVFLWQSWGKQKRFPLDLCGWSICFWIDIDRFSHRARVANREVELIVRPVLSVLLEGFGGLGD